MGIEGLLVPDSPECQLCCVLEHDTLSVALSYSTKEDTGYHD